MKHGFEPGTRCRIGEYVASQSRAIDFSRRQQHVSAELIADRIETGALRCGQLVRQRVGVDQLDTELGEGIRHRRLAAADTAGESDDQRHAC